MENYKEPFEQGDRPNNLGEMGIVVSGYFFLQIEWYIGPLLFSESDVYVPPTSNSNVTRADRVGPARNVSQEVMETFHSSMQRTPPSVIEYKRLREYFETLDSFLNGLYAEMGKAMDDAVAKLSNDTAPSYHRQLCTAKIVDEQIGCELKKAAQVFVTACHQPEPSILSKMPRSCENESFSGLLSSCVLDEALGPTYAFNQLFNASDILRTRLFHLMFAYALCDGQYSRLEHVDDPLELFVEEIGKSFKAAFDDAKQRYWPSVAVEMANDLADESGPLGYPTESDVRNYNGLAKKIADKMKKWNVGSFHDPEHEAFVYHGTDYDMMTDNKWINMQTREQRDASWWTANDTKGQLGTARHAGVNIVLSRKHGARNCGDSWNAYWIKNNSEIVSSAVRKADNSTVLLKVLDEDLTRDKGKHSKKNWRTSDGACFRAMLVIRCAYKFVWLELAWKYYPATSDAPNKVDVDNGSYRYVTDAQCMRVVFIE